MTDEISRTIKGVNILMSRKEAANYLNVRENTLAAWACNGRYCLPFVKIGRRVMYLTEDLEAFITSNRVESGWQP
jgi:excisionase family DNA binding protein